MTKSFKLSPLFRVLPVMLLLLSVLLSSCDGDKFKIKGEISGADNQLVLLEKSDYLGNWMILDSVRANGSGKFSFRMEAPSAPDIYRIEIDGNYVYLPIDSVETITLKGDLSNLSRQHTLTGTPQAEKFAAFDKDMAKAIASKADMKQFKREVYSKYIKDDHDGLLSYYILTQQLDGQMLYNSLDNEDARYFAAVATAFSQYRPGDPRMQYLERTALEGIRARRKEAGTQNVMQANTVNMIEITLPDVDGVNRSLSDELKHGKATVVIFAVMNHPDSPTFNRKMAEILASKAGSVRFYQVSYDDDMYAWRDAARNLPWTNVFDINGAASTVPAQYNVENLPSFYIYSPEGELVDKAETIDDLTKKLSKY